MEDASGACTAHILLMHSLQESSVLGQSPSCLFLVSDWNGFVAEILIYFFLIWLLEVFEIPVMWL